MRTTDGLWLGTVTVLAVIMVWSAPPASSPAAASVPARSLPAAATPDAERHVVATVDGSAIDRAELAADVWALVDGGVLDLSAGSVAWQRAAATVLQAKIDAALIAGALGAQRTALVRHLAEQEITAEIQQHGTRAAWLASLRRRGETAASHLEALATRRGLDALVDRLGSARVADEEVRERLAHHQDWPVAPDAARRAIAWSLLRARHFESGRMLLGQLRAAATIVRQAPFDTPPGGPELAGTLPASEAEEDLD